MRWCVAGDVSNAVKCFERKATQFGGATAKRVQKAHTTEIQCQQLAQIFMNEHLLYLL